MQCSLLITSYGKPWQFLSKLSSCIAYTSSKRTQLLLTVWLNFMHKVCVQQQNLCLLTESLLTNKRLFHDNFRLGCLEKICFLGMSLVISAAQEQGPTTSKLCEGGCNRKIRSILDEAWNILPIFAEETNCHTCQFELANSIDFYCFSLRHSIFW